MQKTMVADYAPERTVLQNPYGGYRVDFHPNQIFSG